jgi:hypothetical protein
MIYDMAPNTGPSKITLREMPREAVANTASLKVTRCARGARAASRRTPVMRLCILKTLST